MEDITLTREIRAYRALAEEAAALESQAKEKKREKEQQKQLVIQLMMDVADEMKLESAADMAVTVDGYRVRPVLKDFYTIKAEDREFGFQALRAVGLGDLITERVDDRTLTKALEAETANNAGVLPERFNKVPLSVFTKTDISMRKE